MGDALALRSFPFDGAQVTAVVSTRHGGVSTGAYGRLNLGAHVGDDPAAVAENRRRLAAALGVDRLTIADQRHTDRVAVVDAALSGRGHDGLADSAAAFPATDAMITDVPGTALAILVADCAPVVFYDPVRRAAGVAHSGRAGTVRGVARKTVESMRAAFGSAPQDLLIGIGPAIGAASYEIGAAEAAEVTAAFGAQGAALLRPSRPGHALFDLSGAVRRQLQAAGVPAASIYDLAIDTRTSTGEFFSDRAARPCGRFAAIVRLGPAADSGPGGLARGGVAGEYSSVDLVTGSVKGGRHVTMARIDPRLRAWGWLTRRMVSITTKSDEQVIALQTRQPPANKVNDWLFGTVAPGVTATDRTVPGPAGDLKVRVYQPAGAAAERPLVLYMHGGGFVLGGLYMGDWICGSVADQVGAVVVSVDYRLAPSHVFPAAVEDCYAALTWAAGEAAALGAAGPLGVMGESAGGTLAAVTCLLARDRGGPAISHQALTYPATDMTRTVNAAEYRSAPFLSAAEMDTYKRLYLGPDGDPANPWASPQLAVGHTGLPPALIQVAEHDPLREDGVRYAAALRDAGVPVRFTEYVGMTHGFVNFPGLSRAAHQAMAEICAEQSAALAPAKESTVQESTA